MELRSLSVCLAFLLVAVISHSSEARHSLERRDADVDFFQDDPGSDNEQNDEGDDDDEPVPNATILTRPEVYKVPIGKGVRLECKIDIPDTTVTWMRGDIGLVVLGTLMADPTKYQKNNTDLIISNVTQADAGGYQCKVEQTPPVQIEHKIEVELEPQAAKITSISASDDGKPAPGADLTLTCTATGFPAPKIIWSKLVNGQNAKIGEGAVHTIKKVRVEDSGTYFCYAMGKSNADTDTIDVSVRRKPKVHVHRAIINSAIGVEALMRCNVHEQEPVSIRWFKGEKEIHWSRYTTRGTESNLTVTPQSDADFGTYTCKAECDFGTHHRSIELVETPVVESLESDGSKLSWSVHSHLPLTNIEIQLIDTVNVSNSLCIFERLESDGSKLSWSVHSHLPLTNIEIQLIDTVNFERLESDGSKLSWSVHSHLPLTNIEIQLIDTFNFERLESDGSKLSWSVHSHLPLTNIEIQLIDTVNFERLESDGSKLSWSVHSHLPLANIEIQLIDTVNGTLRKFDVPVPDHKTHEYDFTYVVNSVEPGHYDAVVKVENSKGMGENSQAVELKEVGPSPGAAHAHHPTTALISTVLMYLLVRML
ncbi:neural cell adhesion molecule 2-like [Cydia amplana]|uniref:neural cell adhesion molecule 2-like n=1 Tax=Cydia amplana TaxID=1869771 RepID=UPI002FE58D26